MWTSYTAIDLFFSSGRGHTRCLSDWSSDVCSSDLLHQFLPDVGAFLGALGAETEEDIGGVGGAMDALHGGDDAELSEARDIGGVEVLRVLDAPAEVLFIRVCFEGVLEDVEGFAVGAVADGVDAELEAVLDGEFGGLADVGGVVGIE